MDTKHTATPWQTAASSSIVGRTIWRNDGDDGLNSGYKRICRNVCSEADAEFIVRACNAHDDLVSALELITRLENSEVDEFDAVERLIPKIMAIANEALAKAGVKA